MLEVIDICFHSIVLAHFLVFLAVISQFFGP